MKRTYYLSLLAVVIFTGCQFRVNSNSSDIEAIRNSVEMTIAGIRAKDINQILNTYSSDALEMPPNQPVIAGIEAIAKEWEIWYSDTTNLPEKYAEPIDKIEVSESGDLGYVRSTSHFLKRTTNGIYDQVQKNIFIYKRENSEWKLIVAIWNDNQPFEDK